MKDTMPTLFIVIQCGGSSREHYHHSFLDEPSALAYIKRANLAAYICLGPFLIPLPEIDDLTESACKTVAWLDKVGYGKNRVTANLKRALSKLHLQIVQSRGDNGV